MLNSIQTRPRYAPVMNSMSDVLVNMENVWVPAFLNGHTEDGKLSCTVKFSQKALDLNLVNLSITVSSDQVLTPEWDPLPSLRLSIDESKADDYFADDRSDSGSSDHELDYVFTDGKENKMTLPKGGFTFNELVDAVEDGLRNAFDLPEVEDMVRLEFLQLDQRFFDVYRASLQYNPLIDTPRTQQGDYKVHGGVRVYKQSNVHHHYQSPAQFNIDHNQVTISNPHFHWCVQRVSFCMVPSHDDYLVHMYQDVDDPIQTETLVNWRFVPDEVNYWMPSSPV